MKLRKNILLLSCFIFPVFLSGCGDHTDTNKNTVNTITANSAADIDIDLTVLSDIMAASELYDMIYEPEDYVGQTVRMSGVFSVYHRENSDQYWFSCNQFDGCCSYVGLDFFPTEDYSYPSDFPAEQETVTVTGVFEIIDEGDYSYCAIKDASLEV